MAILLVLTWNGRTTRNGVRFDRIAYSASGYPRTSRVNSSIPEVAPTAMNTACRIE
jgi:hypothetical protein